VDRRLIELPRTPIAEIGRGGLVKVVGTLRASAPTFTAPLSGATCVWYWSAAQIYTRLRYAPDPITEQKAQDVFVDDETGSALVRMGPNVQVRTADMKEDWCYEPPIPGDERNIATTENVRHYLKSHGVAVRYWRTPFYTLRTLLQRDDFLLPSSGVPEKRAARYREFVLRPGDRVAIVGYASHQPDPTVAVAGLRTAPLRLELGAAADGLFVSNELGVWA
jgi:hypothetical protein